MHTVLFHRRGLLFWACVLLNPVWAWGHSPIFSDGSADRLENAQPLKDVTISQVVYHEIEQPGQKLWLSFTVEQDQEIVFRVGVPYIDRLEDFRPTLVIVGPGLPESDVPLGLPAGAGAVVFETQSVTEPEVFHEEFTGTTSWILGDFEQQFPQSGTYYAVVYAPDDETGKVWMALGEKERFTLKEIFSFGEIVNQAREFHEIDELAVPCFAPLMALGVLYGAVHFVRRRYRS